MTGVATGEEVYNAMKNIALNEGKVMKAGAWRLAFSYAWKHKLIEQLSEEERKKYKEKLIQTLESERRGKLNDNARMIGDILNDPESIQGECHKRIMQAHFQEMIDKKE